MAEAAVPRQDAGQECLRDVIIFRPNRLHMRLRTLLITAGLALTAIGVAFAQLKPWREYPGREYEGFQLPPDYKTPAEWVFARLMYPDFTGSGGYGFRGFRRGFGNWKQGGTSWTTD